MAVLSNNGRLISSLPATSIISATDEFLIQSNGITKRTSYSALTSSILSAVSFNPFINQVRFTNVNNKFTGSFYGNVYGTSTGTNITITAGDGLSGGGILTSNRSLAVDSTVVRTSGTQTVGGSKTFSSIILGDITSAGTSTFTTVDINGGAIDATTIGVASAAVITGTTITANTGFVGSLTGNVTGNLTGDVYNSTATKVLESGNTTTTPNGGVSSAYFYGTSSYANQALTAAYAATGGTIVNGIPIGGTRYQLLAKNSGTNYDAIWTNPITASTVGVANYLTIWDGNRVIKNVNSFYYNTSDYVVELPLRAKTGFYISSGDGGAFTGSLRNNEDLKTITTPGQTRTLNGDKFGSIKLELSSSGTITMSLKSGQTSTILIESNGSGNNVTAWTGLNDTGTVSIYWKNGAVPTVSSGAGKKDIFTFINVQGKIFASAIQNFS
jgi:hypothetical protein